MTPEAKLYQLAASDATLQGYFGTTPFRWFDTTLPQGQIASGACVVVRRVSTVREYSLQGLQDLSQPRFQIDVLAPSTVNKQADFQAARLAAAAVIDFLGTISLAQNNQFGSPATTPPQFPNFLLNQRQGMYPQLQPPTPVVSIDIRVFNLEEYP
jgi:hypothetical protein